MQSKMDEFRDFVRRHPKIRDDVRAGRRTWQNIYEEWIIYGEGDAQWNDYREAPRGGSSADNRGNNISLSIDSIKNIFGYIQRIDPDKLNRTLNSIQKVIQIAQTFGPKQTNRVPYITTPYNDWWD
ncbi:MAG: spore coat protein YlbD [Bacilli bacterium]|jgi:hypothetical protein|nr:spore coat protein YlbD [Bacillota bacterium]NLM31381.1 hypothetical protein [Acholeplasmataceae bacterium]HOA78219.1 spore coat protein YlbD [Bacilli bacterium]HPZ26511.1 spore coat protein YlbD [Bacilli bacterium]HQC88985.1 spore coat protein YlbD [Bacilli bacterium]